MQNFEQIRAHASSHYTVRASDPYLIGIELTLEQGTRHQGIFLAELEGDEQDAAAAILPPKSNDDDAVIVEAGGPAQAQGGGKKKGKK